jgi:hypothetical protein
MTEPPAEQKPFQARERSRFQLTIRHLLFPAVLIFYKREPMASRGQFLRSFGFETTSHEATRILYGRFEGLQYGTLRFTAAPPHVVIERKDGVVIHHNFLNDAGSLLELGSDGVLVLRRSDEPPFQICRIRTVDMIQLIGVYHRLPAELKNRLVLPKE